MTIGLLDFDDIDAWETRLAAELHPLLPADVGSAMTAAKLEYFEDALDLLLSLADRDAAIDATAAWIRSTDVAGYHGSRLIDAEKASIRANGLVPLRAGDRSRRLKRALSSHPNWAAGAEGRLGSAILAHGQRNAAGRREGQVHLTLSKAGLTEKFNHYLTHGSEFDQRVAHALLGDEGTALLAIDGEPTVIQVAVPGSSALSAASPRLYNDASRAGGEIPSLVKKFLQAWSYRLARPGCQSRTLKVDCGMIFYSTIPAEWIRDIAAPVQGSRVRE